MLHTTQVYAEDIDGDSDYDILAPSRYSNEVFWFENKLITGINRDRVTDQGPIQFSLLQNYPNPFNPVTLISYQIPELSFVTLKIYDVLGNEVATLVEKEKSVGNYKIEFGGSDLSSGIYFYQLRSNGYSETKKMIIIK